jgi:hypothetical protein
MFGMVRVAIQTTCVRDETIPDGFINPIRVEDLDEGLTTRSLSLPQSTGVPHPSRVASVR